MEKGKGSSDPLAVLKAFDRLEIGPVKVEEQRVTAPYRVIRGDEADTVELTYRFEEAVFAPGDPGSLNLGNMICAQVALNYGLFCDEIVFHGHFDRPE